MLNLVKPTFHVVEAPQSAQRHKRLCSAHITFNQAWNIKNLSALFLLGKDVGKFQNYHHVFFRIVLHDLSKLVCFSQKIYWKLKEDKSLLKMHFKPLGFSAVDELQ